MARYSAVVLSLGTLPGGVSASTSLVVAPLGDFDTNEQAQDAANQMANELSLSNIGGGQALARSAAYAVAN